MKWHDWGIRLKHKKNMDKLRDEADRERYFEQLRLLNLIDPFSYLGYALVFGIVGFAFNTRIGVIILGCYALWCAIYGLAYLGVHHMFSERIESQNLREELEDEDSKEQFSGDYF